MSEPVNHVRMVVDLRFEGDYWRPEDLVGMATRWINSGLDDRDDLREWKVAGELLPMCAHCGEVIVGVGHSWIGPVPEPGQDPATVKRYHLGREFPDCRKASGACGVAAETEMGV